MPTPGWSIVCHASCLQMTQMLHLFFSYVSGQTLLDPGDNLSQESIDTITDKYSNSKLGRLFFFCGRGRGREECAEWGLRTAGKFHEHMQIRLLPALNIHYIITAVWSEAGSCLELCRVAFLKGKMTAWEKKIKRRWLEVRERLQTEVSGRNVTSMT